MSKTAMSRGLGRGNAAFCQNRQYVEITGKNLLNAAKKEMSRGSEKKNQSETRFDDSPVSGRRIL